MRVALLGTGLMGYPMAERLLKGGHELTVFNRTAAKAEGLKTQGAKIADSSAEAIAAGECVIFMLSDAAAIEDVLTQAADVDFSGKTVIQMSTIAPSESLEFQKRIEALGGEYFECPVLGSRGESAKGELILMVGSTEEQFSQWQEFLKVFGPHPRRIGGVGQAAALKLALNQLIASHAVGFSLSLAYVQQSGVKVEDFMDILKGSFLFAPMFERKLPKWLSRDFSNPNFPAKHMLKDVELILKDAKAKGLATDVLEAARDLIKRAKDQNLGDLDYSVVYEMIHEKYD